MIALHPPHDRFATILETAVVGILETDLDGRVVYANGRACEMLGREREALIGRSVLELTDPASIAESIDALRAVRSGSAGLTFRKRYLRGDGSVLEAESTLNAVRDADGAPAGMLAILIDRTEQAEAERRLREREALQTYLVHLGDTLRPLADAGEIQAAAARVVGEHLGASRILYAEVSGESGDVFIVRHDYRQPGVPPVVGHHRFDDFGAFIAKEFRKEKTLAIGNVREVPEIGPDELAIYDALSFCAFLAVPLVKDRRIVAYLAANHSVPRAWSAHDIAVIEETAERTWAAVQRAHAEAALRDADRRKDEFLATLAHELRNPLSPIRSGVEVLRLSGTQPPEAASVLDMMSRQVFHMVRLVDDLLDVSRISSGKIHLQRQRIDLRDAIEAGIESVRPALAAAGHRLDVSLPEAPVPVDGDAVRLAQIVGNLLGNAIKYSPAEGRIALELDVAGGRAEVSVIDAGIGITREMLPHVFDLFSQGRTAAGMSQGGLGLGLAISKKLAELHAGTLTAESAGEGRGSRFTVSLALAGPQADAPVRTDASPGPAARPLDVLIVDDNRDAADTLAMMLELFGHRVAVAYDGADALAHAARRTPHLVFCDIGMPGMSGHEVASSLRRMPALAGTLLVAVTGWGTAADRDRARCGLRRARAQADRRGDRAPAARAGEHVGLTRTAVQAPIHGSAMLAPRPPTRCTMSLDWTRREAWQVRSRWIGVLILVAFFAYLLSRFLPALYEQERGFVEGETDAFDGTVLDKGRRPRTSTRDWGLVDFFPRVALADGRSVVLEVSVGESDIPAVGAPIAVRCLRDAPARCRMDTRSGTFINVLGFGSIVLIWATGMGLMALRIMRRPRRRAARRGPRWPS